MPEPGDPFPIHIQRRVDAHLRAAATHDKAVTMHEQAAHRLRQAGNEQGAEHELQLAATQRLNARQAREAAERELKSSPG